MLKLKTLLIVVISALLYANITVAKTPDGLTPSVETICDVFSGSAFGLCNAYCEAMDCGDPNQAASNRGCERVNDNFENRTGFRLPEGYRYDNNGQLLNNCEVGPPPPDGCECSGGLNALTLRYSGASGNVVASDSNGNKLFEGNLGFNTQFDVIGLGNSDAIGPQLLISHPGGTVIINTNCSQTVEIGLAFGVFVIIDGSSVNNGKICGELQD